LAQSIHTDDYRALTAILTEARRKAGLTQQLVADRLGKPQSYVAKIEGNERRIDVVEFVAFARAMGIDPANLFGEVIAAIDGDNKP